MRGKRERTKGNDEKGGEERGDYSSGGKGKINNAANKKANKSDKQAIHLLRRSTYIYPGTFS